MQLVRGVELVLQISGGLVFFLADGNYLCLQSETINGVVQEN